MGRQQTLPLDDGEFQDEIWSGVAEEDRQKVVEIFARLLARAIHGNTRKENSNDDDDN